MKKMFPLVLALLVLLPGCKKDASPSDGTTNTSLEITTVWEDLGPSDFDIAEGCIGGILSDLTCQLGEPLNQEYYASQRDPSYPDALEGILYYSTFTVYTYKEGDTEWIEYVEEVISE